MNTTTITLIAAMDRKRGIGFEGDMPWRLLGELQHFKQTTMGKPILMGRKTWESIGRTLPGRQNIVISRQQGYQASGCEVVTSLENALKIAKGNEAMVIGGGMLYTQALPLATRMVLTLVDGDYPADTWFPQWQAAQWQEISRKTVAVDDGVSSSYDIVDLRRRD
ncbi:MAG: dihydrofolate reductase [Xanthomonadales bacterium]|nr:dihydrofolate reductase [Xanthomonadales bacterium]